MPNGHSKLAREAITPSKHVNEQKNGWEESVGRAHVEHVGKAGETGPRGAGGVVFWEHAIKNVCMLVLMFVLFLMVWSQSKAAIRM